MTFNFYLAVWTYHRIYKKYINIVINTQLKRFKCVQTAFTWQVLFGFKTSLAGGNH